MAGETGNAPQLGPCSSYAVWDQVTACCGGLAPVELETQTILLEAATMVMWGLTKQRYAGQCSRVLYPCQPRCVRDSCCRCPQRARFDLGTVPVWYAAVVIDDVEIPVHVEDFQYVVRDDGYTYWPTCDHDWSIVITWGWPIPMDIQLATARLTCEYAKQCQGLACGLDPRTTSYTREGVSVQIADPGALIASGRTGIPFVDGIIGSPAHQNYGAIVDLASDPGYTTTWAP